MTFVASSDVRLVADIEKLIKTKIEIEPMEYEEDQPRERINTGRRMYSPDGSGDDPREVLDLPREARADVPREPRAEAPRERRDGYEERASRTPRPQRDHSRPPAASRDPFFEQPYEAPVTEAAPAWEASKTQPRGFSANIKPKRKVAALFKSVETS